jgi:hypothetical protein
MAAAAAAQSSTAAEPPIRDERTALTIAADLVVARWSLFDGQRTGHVRGLLPVAASPPAWEVEMPDSLVSAPVELLDDEPPQPAAISGRAAAGMKREWRRR